MTIKSYIIIFILMVLANGINFTTEKNRCSDVKNGYITDKYQLDIYWLGIDYKNPLVLWEYNGSEEKEMCGGFINNK